MTPYQGPETPLQPFLDAIMPLICDDLDWVTQELPFLVQKAILQRYSQDRPLEVVSDVIGDGSAYIALPTAPAGQYGTFAPDFSILKRIEYPIGMVPEDDVETGDWELYRKPTGYQIMLKAYSPDPGEGVRLTWTSQHNPDGTSIPASDFHAVCDYAASLALQVMAAHAAQLGDSTMGADSNNYRSKSSEYTSLAKMRRKDYFNHIGVDESDASGVEEKGAMSVGRMTNILSGAGVDRLTHGRFTR